MADKLVPSVDDTGAVRRFVDMGDGTYAEVVAAAPAPAPAGSTPGYPTGATPVQAASGSLGNTVTAAAIPGVAGKTSYITGLQITGAGATAGTVVGGVLSGLLGGSITFAVPIATGPSVGNAPVVVLFNPPLKAAAPNTPITLSVPAYGAGNFAATASVQGFQL